MFNLTTPKAILLGFFMIAISIASLPYSSNILIRDAQALSGMDFLGIENGLNAIARAILLSSG